MITDGLDGQRTLEAVRRALPDDVVVIGGGSSGKTVGGDHPSSSANDHVDRERGRTAAHVGRIRVLVRRRHGLRPIGPSGTVTRADYGQIHEIDGKPAGQFVAGYVDDPGPATYGNPLAVTAEGTTEPYLRVMLGKDPITGALAVPGEVPAGVNGPDHDGQHGRNRAGQR